MCTSNGRSLSALVLIGLIVAAFSTPGCTPGQLIAELPDGSTPPANDGAVAVTDGQMASEDAPSHEPDIPMCSASQQCVEYTPDGPACLPACAGPDAGGCPAGEVCTPTSGCCIGGGCSAVLVFACCPPAGCDTRAVEVDSGTAPSAPPADATSPGSSFIHVAVGATDNGSNHDFDVAAACAADVGTASGAIAYFVSGHPEQLVIAGCDNGQTPSAGIRIAVSGVSGTGTYSTNTVSFIDQDLEASSCIATQPPPASTSWTTTITRLDPVGGTVEGTYIGGPMVPVGKVNDLMGHFTVSHVPDQPHP